jgi:hypothetical protein
MTVEFYKTADPVNVMNKVLSNKTEKSGTLKENCDVLNPSILFNFNPVNYNYAYIPDFHRYYYVGKPVNEGASLWRVDLSVDVLMSWKTGIKSSPCIAAKSSSAYNLYLNDPNYKCYQNDVILMQNFPTGFDETNSRFVLTIFGEKVGFVPD